MILFGTVSCVCSTVASAYLRPNLMETEATFDTEFPLWILAERKQTFLLRGRMSHSAIMSAVVRREGRDRRRPTRRSKHKKSAANRAYCCKQCLFGEVPPASFPSQQTSKFTGLSESITLRSNIELGVVCVLRERTFTRKQ